MFPAKAAFWCESPDCGCPGFAAKRFRGLILETIVRTNVSRSRLDAVIFVRTIEIMKKKMGRPTKGDAPKAGRLEIRVEFEEKTAYDEAAAAAGLERSDWIRETLNVAAQAAISSGGRGNRTRPGKPGS